MFLKMSLGKEEAYGDTAEEVAHLASEVLGGAGSASSPGEVAWPHSAASLSFIDARNGEQDKFPHNFLFVSVNTATGFGALIWCVTDRSGKKGGAYDHVWISNNPNPPASDPQVVVESTAMSFHSPRSCLPIEQLRTVVEEFCVAGTGDRPEGIDWVQGHLNGWRADGPPLEQMVDRNSDPWA
ncbi:Imm1 family immunity protein [Actinoplanes sp. HUAS TT8]|uniref:Imm1 family immunity protein n=1 Tax=Actinoplanes sp. HUAS TT8 TaxID=3447453 RepID=UPI003F524F05